MAKKTVFMSDLSGDTIEERQAAKIRISFEDGRRGNSRSTLQPKKLRSLLARDAP